MPCIKIRHSQVVYYSLNRTAKFQTNLDTTSAEASAKQLWCTSGQRHHLGMRGVLVHLQFSSDVSKALAAAASSSRKAPAQPPKRGLGIARAAFAVPFILLPVLSTNSHSTNSPSAGVPTGRTVNLFILASLGTRTLVPHISPCLTRCAISCTLGRYKQTRVSKSLVHSNRRFYINTCGKF